MTGYRLTKYDRNCIVANATRDNFDSNIDEAKARLKSLNEEIYLSIYGEDLISKIKDIPDDWFHKSYYMSIRLYNGYQMEIDFTDHRPLPQSASRYCGDTRTLLKDKDLGDKLMALDEEIKDLVNEKRVASTKLMSLLTSVSTLKQLKEIWSDGDIYYSHLTPTKKAYVNNVPAILVEDINKIFALPKEEAT